VPEATITFIRPIGRTRRDLWPSSAMPISREEAGIDVHADCRWADATSFADVRACDSLLRTGRQVYGQSGSLSWSQPIGSPAPGAELNRTDEVSTWVYARTMDVI